MEGMSAEKVDRWQFQLVVANVAFSSCKLCCTGKIKLIDINTTN